MTSNKKPRKNSSRKKKSQLDTYLTKTHNEINNCAEDIVCKVVPELEPSVVRIDDDIRPVLTVLFSDIFGGSHETGVTSAGTVKCIMLAMKASQEGCLPEPIPVPDIMSVLPALGTAFNTAIATMSSLTECLGKNISRCDDADVFQYGWCSHLGCVGHLMSGIAYDIGICIGNICNDKQPDRNYKTASELIKKLPNSRYKKRLIELINRLYTKVKQPEQKEQQPEPEPDTQQQHLSSKHTENNNNIPAPEDAISSATTLMKHRRRTGRRLIKRKKTEVKEPDYTTTVENNDSTDNNSNDNNNDNTDINSNTDIKFLTDNDE